MYAPWPLNWTVMVSASHAHPESSPSEDDLDYLRLLRQRFDLPLWYRRIDTDRSVLEKKS